MRPFEVGDLITLKGRKKETHIVINVNKKEYYSVLIINESTGQKGCVRLIDVNFVRKPRKGCKESRDIVAISAIHYRAKRNKWFRVFYFAKHETRTDAMAHAIEEAMSSVQYEIYQEQKEMLR